MSQQIAERDFAPHNRASDLDEPRFDGTTVHIVPEVGAALRRYAESGLLSSTMDYDLGGGQLPHVVAAACNAWFQAANAATFSYPFLTVANANLLLAHASPELIEQYLPPMTDGRWLGTMCLSEPGVGSSLADITTRAEARTDGSYRIFGNKMWISGGDHELAENIAHLVLARDPSGAPGVAGLSLYIVPKYLTAPGGAIGERNDVALAGLNHKMGYRGTVNTLLNFGEGVHQPGGEPGAVGYLIGEPNRGLFYMFHMMNEARLGIGTGAAALGYTAYLKSLAYARTRIQGRPLAGRGPDVKPVALIEHPDIRRMLLSQKAYVEGGLALNLYCWKLLDEQHTASTPEQARDAELLLDILTPVAKSWPSQWCLHANDLAIQIHGGYGYTRDYDVEQHYRDNRLNLIHEGTQGIQAIDLLGRKARLQDGACLRLLTDRIHATIARAPATDTRASALAAQLRTSVESLTSVVDRLWEKGDPEIALANATIFLEAAGHIVVAWIWLEQLLATGNQAGDFYDGKRHTASFFFTHELPRCRPQLELLARLDSSTRDVKVDWF